MPGLRISWTSLQISSRILIRILIGEDLQEVIEALPEDHQRPLSHLEWPHHLDLPGLLQMRSRDRLCLLLLEKSIVDLKWLQCITLLTMQRNWAQMKWISQLQSSSIEDVLAEIVKLYQRLLCYFRTVRRVSSACRLKSDWLLIDESRCFILSLLLQRLLRPL